MTAKRPNQVLLLPVVLIVIHLCRSHSQVLFATTLNGGHQCQTEFLRRGMNCELIGSGEVELWLVAQAILWQR